MRPQMIAGKNWTRKTKAPNQKSNLLIYDNTNMDYSSTSSPSSLGKKTYMKTINQ